MQVVWLPPASVGGRKKLVVFDSPVRKRERGGCLMGWNDVLTLLTAIGGAVYMTFQITWTIFKEIHNNKK